MHFRKTSSQSHFETSAEKPWLLTSDVLLVT